MEQLPTFDKNLSATRPPETPMPAGNITAAAVKRALEPMRSPAEDDGKSLSEMAQRDLDAALKLLVDRAQYITGASGAAIALEEDGAMICRATSGDCAPQRGSRLQVNTGLTGECVRLRQILRCDNAETDSRVNTESCRTLGIVSVLVAPLLQEEEVLGVFELFSGRASAFEERDTVAVQRLGEMIQTAVAHARAAVKVEQRFFNEPGTAPQSSVAQQVASASQSPAPEGTADAGKKPEREKPAAAKVASIIPPLTVEIPEKIGESATAGHFAQQNSAHKCESCGFPVSEGRKLCVDCQEAADSGTLTTTPAFLSQYSERQKSSGWLHANIYWVGVVLISAATAAALMWLR